MRNKSDGLFDLTGKTKVEKDAFVKSLSDGRKMARVNPVKSHEKKCGDKVVGVRSYYRRSPSPNNE